MTKEQIYQIKISDEKTHEIVETHISWVIIGSKFVYKIKKPVNYGFVDFSTLAKRKYYCEQEIALNNRLTEHMYLDVVQICLDEGNFIIESSCENVIDFAVKMVRKDTNRQMHLLLEENKVKGNDIIRIASKITLFHESAKIIHSKFRANEFVSTFNDIKSVINFVAEEFGTRYSNIITEAIDFSNRFVEQYQLELKDRMESGMIRDCHGDLHSGNIFLEDEPVIFDCIEFNPSFRQIDLLYEVAFFCMDLDSFGRRDLGKLFMDEYTRQFPDVLKNDFDKMLFIYYKLCRANIKTKVIALKLMQHNDISQSTNELDELKRYLRLMLWYHHELLNHSLNLN